MTSKKYVVNAKRWPGVYGYNSDSKKIGGKPDVCYYITFKVDGRKVWEKIGWKSEGYTPQIASEERASRVRQARHGETVKTSKEIRREKQLHNRTIDELKEAYFKSERGKNLKGRKSDLNRYEKHLEILLGKRRIDSLSPLDIDRVMYHMKGYAAATVANTLELLRRIINYGIKTNLCPALQFKISIPKKDNEVTEYLTPEETQRLMKALDEWPNKDVSRMLKLAWLTGMRRGEIFKLQNHDIDFRNMFITLRNPKGKKTVSIPMSEPVGDLLKEQMSWRDEVFPDSTFIFPGKKGNQRTDSSAVDRIKDKAKLPKKFRIFHGLRHHMAVTLASSGEYTLDMIGELLTHKSTAITRRYAKFLPDAKRKAANRAAELIQKQVQHKVKEIKSG